jgi:CRP/FNR family transcriptional regulator, cyclic AMP receptor protein
LYFIHWGRVRITTVSARGKEAHIAVIGAGDFCGGGCFIGDVNRMTTATCVLDSTICPFREDRVFAEFFVARVLTDLVRLREVVESHIIDA